MLARTMRNRSRYRLGLFDGEGDGSGVRERSRLLWFRRHHTQTTQGRVIGLHAVATCIARHLNNLLHRSLVVWTTYIGVDASVLASIILLGKLEIGTLLLDIILQKFIYITLCLVSLWGFTRRFFKL